jgi:Golgi SNAP receptor complex protein 2
MLSAQERIDASLQRSQIETSHMIDMGVASLQKLREQGMTLKNAHRKMLDIANQLGLSQTTIRWIERRSLEDMYIFWAGVIITLGIMAYFLFFR